MDDTGIYGLKPIQFTNIRYSGNLGSDWLMADYKLSKLLVQNILYITYQKPKTKSEIARLLGVPISVTDEEIKYLENNGFLDKVSKDRYLSNIYLSDYPKDILEKKHSIYTKYAKIICSEYIPLLLNEICSAESPLRKNIYFPKNDINFLMWSVISLACSKKFKESNNDDLLSKFFVKRNDGSENIVGSTIKNNYKLSFNEDTFRDYSMTMFNFDIMGRYPLSVWQFDTNYDSRKKDFMLSIQHNFTCLYDFMNGTLIESETNADRFNRMIDKGLLVYNTKEKYVNMIICKNTLTDFINLLPDMPESIISYNISLSEEIYELVKPFYPKRYHDLCLVINKYSITNNDMITRILYQLLLTGILKPLNELQKQTVNMIMFTDIIP